MKLIDILNLIAKGELEEGTKIKIGNDIYLWNKGMFMGRSDGEYETFLDPMHCLDAEVEIIGHDTNAATKIEEVHYTVGALEHPSYNESWLMNCVRANRDKLNEVIRVLNRRGE